MKIITQAMAVGGVTAVLLTSAAFAQTASPKRIEELSKKTIVIDGRATPELVPLHDRMALFFAGFRTLDAVQVQKFLSAADVELLSNYADHHEVDDGAERVAADETFLSVARRADPMSPQEIYNAMQASQRKLEQFQDARYERLLARLSPAGAKALQAFMFEHVRPVFSKPDDAAMLAEAPDFYKEQIVLAYQAWLKGELPVELPPPPHTPAYPVPPPSTGRSLAAPDAARTDSQAAPVP